MSESRNHLFGLSAKAKEQLVKQMIERRVKRPGSASGSDKQSRGEVEGGSIEESYFRFDQLPGYQELHIQKAAADRLGLSFMRCDTGYGDLEVGLTRAVEVAAPALTSGQ